MRKIYHEILKTCFHTNLIQSRDALGLTQAEMAEILAMDERSYSDLDLGKSCCSNITLALFLARVCKDPEKFLEDLRHAFEG